MIRTLLVDDEPLAREGLRLRLAAEPDVTVVGEAGDGQAAVEAIQRLRPDLLFLDVQMPDHDGFAVLERAAGEHLPLVVFCTAFDAYALQAFSVHALDYLMKPLSKARLADAVARARRQLALAGDAAQARLAGLLEAHAPRALPRLLVSHGRRFVVLPAEELEWAQAAGNYVRLLARGTEFLLRRPLQELARQLDAARFVRIHRSTLVNLEYVSELRTQPQHDLRLSMRDGALLRVGRSFRSDVRRQLQGGRVDPGPWK